MFRKHPAAGPSAGVEHGLSDSSAAFAAADGNAVSAIRRRCLERGWDLRELARRAGVSRTTLHHLLSGATQRPHIATVSRLATALGLDAGRLAGGSTCSPERVPHSAWRAGREFDRHTNPAVTEAARARPELFAGWSGTEWDELYSTFGVGGNLSPEGVAACAEAINERRETTHKLHLVLETHLADVARGLIDTLYGMVCASQDAAAATLAAPVSPDTAAAAADRVLNRPPRWSDPG